MVEAIRERVSMRQTVERLHIEWQTKILAGFISSTVQSEKAARELHKAAQNLSMLPQDEKAPAQPAEPRTGSFEKLTGLFGGGMRR